MSIGVKSPSSGTGREALFVQLSSAGRVTGRRRCNHMKTLASTAGRFTGLGPRRPVVQRFLSLKREPLLDGLNAERCVVSVFARGDTRRATARVAEALAARGTLSGDDVRRLVGEVAANLRTGPRCALRTGCAPVRGLQFRTCAQETPEKPAFRRASRCALRTLEKSVRTSALSGPRPPASGVRREDPPRRRAKDACEALGLDDHKVAVRKLDSDEVCSIPLTDALGRIQETLAISESGLYALVSGYSTEMRRPTRGRR